MGGREGENMDDVARHLKRLEENVEAGKGCLKEASELLVCDLDLAVEEAKQAVRHLERAVESQRFIDDTEGEA
jgi:hypothetical protein